MASNKPNFRQAKSHSVAKEYALRKQNENSENSRCHSCMSDIEPAKTHEIAKAYENSVTTTITNSVLSFIDNLDAAKKYKDLGLIVDGPGNNDR